MHNIGLYTGNMQSAYAIIKVVELSKLAPEVSVSVVIFVIQLVCLGL